jgi:TonB family protein
MTGRYPEHFKRTFAYVTGAHLLLLLILLIWAVAQPKQKPLAPPLVLLRLGDLVKGNTTGLSEGPKVGKQWEPAAPAPPAAAAKPAPEPAKPVTPPAPQKIQTPPKPQPVTPPEPVKAVEPTPAPEPTPKPADPNTWSPEKSKPVKPKKPTPTQSVEKVNPDKAVPADKPSRPKVDLSKLDLTKEVSRSNGTAGSSRPTTAKGKHASPVDGNDEQGTGEAENGVRGMSKEGVAEKLGAALKNSGVTNAVKIGRSGDPNGGGNDNAWYYTIIRDQMYTAWQPPMTVSSKRLHAIIQILVEKSGAISKVELLQSSGNQEYDDSALSAARSVGRIKQPLPEGLDGNITITFNPKE